MFLRQFTDKNGEVLSLGFREAPSLDDAGNLINSDFSLGKSETAIYAKIGSYEIDGRINPTVVISISNYQALNPEASNLQITIQPEVEYTWSVEGVAESETLPVNAGNYTLTVKTTETEEYESVTASANFEVTAIPLTDFSVSIENWNYGETPSTPTVAGNTGGGTVTYLYKVAGGEYSSTVPTEVGEYVVKASVPAAGNYAAAEAEDSFSIIGG